MPSERSMEACAPVCQPPTWSEVAPHAPESQPGAAIANANYEARVGESDACAMEVIKSDLLVGRERRFLGPGFG